VTSYENATNIHDEYTKDEKKRCPSPFGVFLLKRRVLLIKVRDMFCWSMAVLGHNALIVESLPVESVAFLIAVLNTC